jgi:hypothetical protein
MQVYKLNLGYSYYAVLVRPNEYLIIAPCDERAAQNGFAVGSLIDEVEPCEIEPTDLDYTTFELCQTWLFQKFCSVLIEPKEIIAAARAAATAELEAAKAELFGMVEKMLTAAEEMAAEQSAIHLAEVEKIKSAAEVGSDITRSLIHLVELVGSMRLEQKKGIRGSYPERRTDQLVATLKGQMRPYK